VKLFQERCLTLLSIVLGVQRDLALTLVCCHAADGAARTSAEHERMNFRQRWRKRHASCRPGWAQRAIRLLEIREGAEQCTSLLSCFPCPSVNCRDTFVAQKRLFNASGEEDDTQPRGPGLDG